MVLQIDPQLMIHISPEDIKLYDDVETLSSLVCERIGYSPDSVSEQIHSKVMEIIQKGLNAVGLEFLVRTTAIDGRCRGRIDAEAITIDSKKWSALLSKMESPDFLCCFMLTLGKQIDIVYENFTQKDLFDQFVLDAFGAVMVEKAADQMEASIGKQLRKNHYECSRRFSPGYCDWELKSGQETICRFLEPEKIGVRCMSSGTMIPVKSVSAAMVVARHVPWTVPCRFCREIKCPYRREKNE